MNQAVNATAKFLKFFNELTPKLASASAEIKSIPAAFGRSFNFFDLSRKAGLPLTESLATAWGALATKHNVPKYFAGGLTAGGISLASWGLYSLLSDDDLEYMNNTLENADQIENAL